MFIDNQWVPFSDNENPVQLAFEETEFIQIGPPIEYNGNSLRYYIDDKYYDAQKKDNYIIINRFEWSSYTYFNGGDMRFYIPNNNINNNVTSPFFQQAGKVYLKTYNKNHRIYMDGSEPFIRHQKNKVYVKELMNKKPTKPSKPIKPSKPTKLTK
jgi:hypothetical protein